MRKLVVAFALIFCMVLTATAHEVPDLSREGSIRVTMRYGGSAISGGEMTLYRVGDVQEDDGNYSFILTQTFAGSGVSLKNLQSSSAAKQLAEFAVQRGIIGLDRKIGTDGTVEFENLKPGLYLLVQKKAAKGFEIAAPFFVSLPMMIEGNYHYEVDAGPKVSPTPETGPTQPNEEVPKTGQSRWPIWMFVLSGAGLVLLIGRRKRI